MAAESDQPEIPDEMPFEEARQYLIWFLGRQDLDELSDEEIIHDDDLTRHAFHQVGAYDGSTNFRYRAHDRHSPL